MKEYFLGLDGGGTKTHILLYERQEGLLDLYTGRGSNYEGMPGGYNELSQVLSQMFDTILGRNGIKAQDIKRAAFGMAGVDTNKQHEEISKVLANLGFKDFVLNNDAFLGVKAGTSRGVGISCVSGSGFSVVGIDAKDNTFQTAGMGTVTGDYGGGWWVAPEAMSYVHGQLFRRYAPSLMTEPVMELLGITHPNDYMEAIHHKYYNGDMRSFTLAVCKIAFDAASRGDAGAKGILERSGRAYGECILGILDNLDFSEPPEIALTGSLFQKHPNSHLVTTIDDFLKRTCGQAFTIRILDVPSVLGALFWAMGDVPEEERATLREKVNALPQG